MYGVEPTSYYIKNLLLNFNGVAVLGILSVVLVAVSRIIKTASLSLKTSMVLLGKQIWKKLQNVRQKLILNF